MKKITICLFILNKEILLHTNYFILCVMKWSAISPSSVCAIAYKISCYLHLSISFIMICVWLFTGTINVALHSTRSRLYDFLDLVTTTMSLIHRLIIISVHQKLHVHINEQNLIFTYSGECLNKTPNFGTEKFIFRKSLWFL